MGLLSKLLGAALIGGGAVASAIGTSKLSEKDEPKEETTKETTENTTKEEDDSTETK